MLSKNILLYPIYCALFLTSYSFQLIGCDRDPETGEKIETSESSKNTTNKHYCSIFFTNNIS